MDKSQYGSALLDIMQDGLIVVDSQGVIVDMNPAAIRMLGYQPEELIGLSCQTLNCTGCTIFDQGRHGEWCSLYKEGRIQAKECVVQNKDGTSIFVQKNASVLKDRNGEVIGAVEIMTDISERKKQESELKDLRHQLSLDDSYHGLVGKSKTMQRIFELVDYVAQTTAPVMITGKSGTGKELIARAIHEAGTRKGKPFIKVNCAALNENLLESELFGHVKGSFTGADQTRIGRFEAANGGTLFLDEIGDIPPATQVKLLRVLEEKEIERVGDNRSIPVDVRIVTATNKDLEGMVQKEQFREDLFFRINVFPIHCPSIQDRKEDIHIILQKYVKEHIRRGHSKVSGLSSEALKALCDYSWPGNVREIRNAIEYAFVLCQEGKIKVDHLPSKITSRAKIESTVSEQIVKKDDERDRLIMALKNNEGNQSKAAEYLGVSRVTIWKRIKKFEIKPSEYLA